LNRIRVRQLGKRGAVIGAALALHIAVLLPIALSSPPVPPPSVAPEILFLPVTLGPDLSGRVRAPSPSRPPAPPVPRRPAEPTGPTRDAPVPDAPATPGRPGETAAAAGALDDPWGGRGRLVPLQIPCPAAPGDRTGERLCRVGPAPDRDREVYADVAPSRGRSDQAREEGFARQAQANEAWRDYTRGEGAYPGLRSLFTER
jgi:hypothetical protein